MRAGASECAHSPWVNVGIVAPVPVVERQGHVDPMSRFALGKLNRAPPEWEVAPSVGQYALAFGDSINRPAHIVNE